MSSEDVAKYLYEVASNERKLQYCRQLLASNPNFIPECVYNLKDSLNTNTQTRSEFIENIRSLGLGCNGQEESLIFNYFQIDSKNYITFGQYTDFVLPQADSALKKLVSNRKKEQFTFDFTLKFCLQKYFVQIIENKVKLELLCRFTFPISDEKKMKTKRLDADGIFEFMKAHGRFPDNKVCQVIARELSLNKGDCKRHKLITEFILQFNQKNRKAEPLPEVLKKDPVMIASSSAKNPSTVTKKQNIFNKNNAISRIDFSASKAEINPLLANRPLAISTLMETKGPQRQTYNPLQPISQVEERIQTLMSEVSFNRKNSSPIKQMYRRSSGIDDPIMQNSIIQSIKGQIQRQKESNIIINTKKGHERQTSEVKRRPDRSEERRSPGRISNEQNLQYEAVTEKREKTARVYDSRARIRGEPQKEGSYSQLIYKPPTRVSQDLSASPDKFKQYSMIQKIDRPYQDRIEYLKSLVDEKESVRA